MATIYFGHTGSTPIGDLWVAVNPSGLIAVDYPTTHSAFATWLEKHNRSEVIFDPEKVETVVKELLEYIEGKRRNFSVPIDWSVLSGFNDQALKITFGIPYGETRTYKDIAEELGNPRAARAVGRAEATNPMPIVIPCHRVVGSDQKLHGYGGGDGLPTKAWLLELEGAVIS